MSVVLPGEINQLTIGFLITLCFYTVLLVARPYKRPEDDMIALAASFSLAVFFFFSLILKYQTLTEAVQDSLEGTPGAPTPTTGAAGAPVRTAAPPAKGGCCAIA